MFVTAKHADALLDLAHHTTRKCADLYIMLEVRPGKHLAPFADRLLP